MAKRAGRGAGKPKETKDEGTTPKKARISFDLTLGDLKEIDDLLIAELKRAPKSRPTRTSIAKWLLKAGLERVKAERKKKRCRNPKTTAESGG